MSLGLPKPSLINVSPSTRLFNDSIVTTDNDSDNTPKRNDTRFIFITLCYRM